MASEANRVKRGLTVFQLLRPHRRMLWLGREARRKQLKSVCVWAEAGSLHIVKLYFS
jgi:hypothetical protein